MNEAIVEFSFTETGARKVMRNGYQYVKQKYLGNELTSWECIERRNGNCKIKVKLNAINYFVEQVQHINVPSTTRCELTKVHASIKMKALFTYSTT